MFTRLLNYAYAATGWDVAPSQARTHIGSMKVHQGDQPDPAWRACVFGLFANLPDEVLAKIVGYVNTGELRAWSEVCTGARRVLWPERLRRRLPEVVPAVVSLREIQRAVVEIERWRMPRAERWLRLLAQRIPVLDGVDAPAAFALLLDAIRRLPPYARQEPLGELVRVLTWQAERPESGKSGEYRASSGTRVAIPLAQEQRLFDTLCALAAEDGTALQVDFLHRCSVEMAQSRQPSDWNAETRYLPPADQARVLAAVIARTSRIAALAVNAPAWQAWLALALEKDTAVQPLLLATLAVPNRHLGQNEAARRCEVMMPLLRRLSPSQRPAVAAALAYLSMLLPEAQATLAWVQLLGLLPALEPARRGELAQALYGALACLPHRDPEMLLPDDRTRYLHQLHRMLQAFPAEGVGTTADAPRQRWFDPIWHAHLNVDGTSIWIQLPAKLAQTVMRFLDAQHALPDRAPMLPERLAASRPSLRARQLEQQATRLDNRRYFNGKPTYSFDNDATRWYALLAAIRQLPPAVQLAPLTAQLQAVDESVRLYTRHALAAEMGLPVGPTPRTAAYQALALAGRDLPPDAQVEWALRIAEPMRTFEMWKWSCAVVPRAPVEVRGELLLKLTRSCTWHTENERVQCWRLLYGMALELPRLPQLAVLQSLRDASISTRESQDPEMTALKARLTQRLSEVSRLL